MAIIFWRNEQHIFVGGQTYPYREVLRDLGGIFDRERRMWSMPHNEAALAAVAALSRRVGGREIQPNVDLNVVIATSAKAPSTRGASAASTPSSASSTQPLPELSVNLPSSSQQRELSDTFGSPSGARPRTLTEALVSPSGFAMPERVTAPKSTVVMPASQPSANAVAVGLSISELYQKVSLALSVEFPRAVWVIGEIHNLNQRAQGFYLQLSEAKGGDKANAGTVTVNATLWRSDAHEIERRLGKSVFQKVLAEGMQVRVLAQVSLFRDRGHVSLRLVDVDAAFTQGTLAMQREALVREIRALGLYEANRSLPLPLFPFNVGLITADESRAKSDFLDQLLVQGFPGQVLFYPAAMQGEAVASQVASGIVALSHAGCDLIVITRGGGSAADLRWFDQKELCLALARSRLPIIAAIGHHDDVSIAEELACVRQKTPTAAADFVISLFRETQGQLDRMAGQLSAILENRMTLAAARGQSLATRLGRAAAETMARYQQRADEALFRLSHNTTALINRRSEGQRDLAYRLQQSYGAQSNRYRDAVLRLRYGLEAATQQSLRYHERMVQQLESAVSRADPSPWLEKGWTQLMKGSLRIHSLTQIQKGELLHARLRDGSLHMRVEDLSPAATTSPSPHQSSQEG